MKKIYLLLSLLAYFVLPLRANQLDIGEDVDFEYRYIRRDTTVLSSEFRQRIKFYLTGYMQNNIEVGLKLQSAGIMNSTNTFVLFEGAKIQNLDPFFENAYIKINKYYGYPVSISIGKLPINWVEGVLVSDNQIGLPAVMVEVDAPFGVKVEGYHCRARNDLLDISGIKGYGIRSIKNFGFRSVELDYTIEDYESTKPVKRTIYGGMLTRNMHKGLEYSFFAYKMKGEKGGEKFDGHAMGAYGKFEGVVDPIGKGGAWIRYILGSGDQDDDEKGFLPILSSIESSMIGDYYGRYREYRRLEDGTLSNISLSHSIANVSILRNALYATVKDDISVFMIRSTYKKHQPEKPLGGALTLGLLYKYDFIECEVRYTQFTPEAEYNYYEGDRPTKIYTVGVNARF
jgi:hypothetical protein